ncbi:hypothetical protein PG997_011695 [Apiospora hydei]|uniref:C2H2-type domain-containing protein n=1 Tax=Apiospora hydei TaxID=1337664 RepID=A0ABR1VJS8_9PEZI
MVSKPPKPRQIVARTRNFGHFLGGAVTGLLKRSLHGLSRNPNKKLKGMPGFERLQPPDGGDALSPRGPTKGSRPGLNHLELQLHDLDNSFNVLRNLLVAYWCYFWCPQASKFGSETDFAESFLENYHCIVEAHSSCEDGAGSGSGSGSGGTDPTTFDGTTATNSSWNAPRNSQKGNGKDSQDPDRRGNKSQRGGTSIVSAGQGARQLLCPWFFQGRWGELCSHKCNRVGDVRQHIFRRHRQPLHCPNCGVVCNSEQTYQTHITQRTCIPAAFDHAGVTPDQWSDICARAQAPPHTVNGGEEERWFQIWDILFPGQPRPRSPYTDGSIFTMRVGDIAHRFLDEGRAWDLIYELIPMDTPNVHPNYRQELHTLFEDLLRRLVARAGEEDRLHGFSRAP